MILPYRRFLIAPLLAAILVSGCGASDFAGQLRTILALAPGLVNSLNLGDKRAATLNDFSDLAQGAGMLSDELKTCGQAKPCKLSAVERFEVRFWDIERRGHFKLSPRLKNIETILRSVIQAAKVYYGFIGQSTASGPVPPANAEKVLNEKLAELKKAMQAQ